MLDLGKNKNRKKSHGTECLGCDISIFEGCLAYVKQMTIRKDVGTFDTVLRHRNGLYTLEFPSSFSFCDSVI